MQPFCLAVACATAALATGAPTADEIKNMPGWDQALPSKQYSGFISVTDKYDQHIMVHYNFVESQNDPSTDPVILWQQGGPGSSGFGYGYMTELGPFHLSAASLAGNPAVPKLEANPYSWDHVGNLLILEHPPGTGFSYCHDGTGKLVTCQWDDDTQAEAYLLELEGWFKAFPEYAGRELFITGESYAGLLVPNLMNQMVVQNKRLNLQAVALGNACTGTPGQSKQAPGQCNLGGSFDTQHNIDLFHGHGMLSKKSYKAIYAACNFTCGPEAKACHGPWTQACQKLIGDVSNTVGEYNIYNIYDTCGSGNMSSSLAATSPRRSGGAMGTLLEHRDRLAAQMAGSVTGGPPFSYPCGTGDAVDTWMNNPTVRTAINVPQKAFYGGRSWPIRGMTYSTYTHASIDLWPMLIKQFRTVIYNGDVDACVPFNGNEDWTAGLGLDEAEAWRPWTVGNVPAGYVTAYKTEGPADLTFITVKEAGHLVPGYQPERAYAMLTRFLAGKGF